MINPLLSPDMPQPWHPQSSIVHEAALAVAEVAPSKYFDFVDAVYDGIAAVRMQ